MRRSISHVEASCYGRRCQIFEQSILVRWEFSTEKKLRPGRGNFAARSPVDARDAKLETEKVMPKKRERSRFERYPVCPRNESTISRVSSRSCSGVIDSEPFHPRNPRLGHLSMRHNLSSIASAWQGRISPSSALGWLSIREMLRNAIVDRKSFFIWEEDGPTTMGVPGPPASSSTRIRGPQTLPFES